MNTDNGTWSVELVKQQLVFSAAHFITFGDEVCESLHGHNYGVRCTVEGGLNHQGYVVDFIALRDSLAEIAGFLDHHVLLPAKHPRIAVQSEVEEVIVRYESKRWVFPAADCRILPLENTTAELLARYIATELTTKMGDILSNLDRVKVGVDENNGQWGSWSFSPKGKFAPAI